MPCCRLELDTLMLTTVVYLHVTYMQLDPAYHRMPSDADEVGSGCLLLSHLRCFDDSAHLMLDYSTIATAADDDSVAVSNTSTTVNIQLLKGGCSCMLTN